METIRIMADKDFPDSGILSKNDRKRAGSNDPDHKGFLDATCEKCGHRMHRDLAAWIRTTRDGSRKFFSLSFKPKADRQLSPTPQDGADDAHF
jgi:hypothetical protein